jgi:predicted transcriptional regulator
MKKIVKFMNEFSFDIRNTFNISSGNSIEEMTKKLEGVLEWTDCNKIVQVSNSFIVKLNKDDKQKMFRFSQEIAFLFVKLGYKVSNELWNNPVNEMSLSVEEIEKLNIFARAFLIPYNEYLMCLDRRMRMSSIAEYFGVSISTVLQRGRDLDLIS